MKGIRQFIISSLLLTLLMIMYCSALNVNGSNDDNLTREELKQLLNSAVLRECPKLKNSIKQVKNVCRKLEKKAQNSEGILTKSFMSKSISTHSLGQSVDLTNIVSGYGYSVFNHEVKLPVIKSMNVKILQTPIISTKEKQFHSPRSFYNHIYNFNASTLTATLYSDTFESASKTYHKLFKSKTEINSISSKYIYYSVGGDRNLTFTDDFNRIFHRLPKKYDSSIYKMILKYFGERVMTETHYGGIVGQTNIVRSCYSREHAIHYAGLSFQNFIQSNNSTDNLFIPNTFLKYSKIAARDIIGGNPEISHTRKRIKTFAKNPSPVKFRTIPIWEVMPEGSHQRKNLKIAHEKFLEKAIAKKEKRIQRIENMKTKHSARPILLKVFFQQGPCGNQDLTRDICRAGNNGIYCKSGNQRPACTGLVNKAKDIMLRRSSTPKLLTSKCVGVMNLFGAVRGVPECSYKGQLKLYAIRNDDDEIQLEMKYAYYKADQDSGYYYEDGPTYTYQEESIYVSEKRKEGGCIVVNSRKFTTQIYGLETVKWKVCFNCQPQIGKDHYSFECSCPYLME